MIQKLNLGLQATIFVMYFLHVYYERRFEELTMVREKSLEIEVQLLENIIRHQAVTPLLP